MISAIEQISNNQISLTQLDLVVLILSTYNCRANEVLKAKWKNFFPQKFLILEGSKKSSNVIVRDREILSQIANLYHIDATFIFPSVTYNILYHFIKKTYSHQFITYKKRKNYKVTHGFRYSAVSLLDNEEKIRDILHHRGISSGKFYKLHNGVKNANTKKT